MRIQVSKLAYYSFCPERAKLMVTGIAKQKNNKVSKARIKGIQMHRKLSAPFLGLNRGELLYKLGYSERAIYQRELDGNVICGRFDDLRVIPATQTDSKKEEVSFIEIKTTSKKRYFRFEREQAKFQLQIYLWLMKPIIESWDYALHSVHYIMVYSQRTGELLHKEGISYNPEIENILRKIILEWQGLAPMKYPEAWKCRYCPHYIKEKCRAKVGFVF